MRGLPEILTLFIVYNGIGLVLNRIVAFVLPDVGHIEFSPFAAGGS